MSCRIKSVCPDSSTMSAASFLQVLNNCHSMKFTMEKESNHILLFLSMQLRGWNPILPQRLGLALTHLCQYPTATPSLYFSWYASSQSNKMFLLLNIITIYHHYLFWLKMFETSFYCSCTVLSYKSSCFVLPL